MLIKMYVRISEALLRLAQQINTKAKFYEEILITIKACMKKMSKYKCVKKLFKIQNRSNTKNKFAFFIYYEFIPQIKTEQEQRLHFTSGLAEIKQNHLNHIKWYHIILKPDRTL